MPITWNEAREIEEKLRHEQEMREMRQREIDGREPMLSRFRIGSQWRISRLFHDARVWGDTVEITNYCPFEGTPAVCADHETYGDVGWIFTAEELEPLP